MFAFSTDDFVIIGILPNIAKGLHDSEALVGQLVTLFSLTYAISIPLITIFSRNWPRKWLVVAGFITFIVANLFCAVAQNYPQLLAVRILAAIAAASEIPVIFSIAGKLAPAEKRTRYLATVGAGLTAALIVGVPIGTWIAYIWGWRASFLLIAFLSTIALLVLWRKLPNLEKIQPESTANRMAPLTRPAVALCLAGITIVVLANTTIMIYLAPFMLDVAHVGPRGLGIFLVLGGVAGIAGGQFSGIIAGRKSANAALLLTILLFIFAMTILAIFRQMGYLPAVAVAPVVMLWYVAAWGVPPAAQTKMLTYANPANDQAIALTSTAVSVGSAGGGAFGGVILAKTGTEGLPIAAALLAVISLYLLWQARMLWRRSPHAPESGQPLAEITQTPIEPGVGLID